MTWLRALWRRWFSAPETLCEERARLWFPAAHAKRYGKTPCR